MTVYYNYSDTTDAIRMVYATQAESTTDTQTGETASSTTDHSVEPGWFHNDGTVSVDKTPTIAERRERWLTKLGYSFRAGMELIKDYWPREEKDAAGKTAAENIVELELPHWWRDLHSLAAAVASGRILTDMTNDEIDLVVDWPDVLVSTGNSTLKTNNVIHTWYKVGKSIDSSDSRRIGYRSTVGWSVGGGSGIIYTDAYTITTSGSRRVLQRRNPDFAWTALTVLAGDNASDYEPDDWDPENPT